MKSERNIVIKIKGFKIAENKEYWEKQIISFVDKFIPENMSEVNITKNGVLMFTGDGTGASQTFSFHTTFSSKDEVLSFIATLNVAHMYKAVPVAAPEIDPNKEPELFKVYAMTTTTEEAEVLARTEEEALKLANDNPDDYSWNECGELETTYECN